ncbi:MAG: hypothetical protein AAGD25_12085 [Cyanobacteria bacterium P01_F01_bin.150]
MNDANAPLNNLDFPANVMNSSSAQQQASYSQKSDHSFVFDETAHSSDSDNVEALITLVQDLNQQNHELLNRITVLEGELTHSRSAVPHEASEKSTTNDAFPSDQVTHLLDQLEFAQQANQRQDIRIESLTTQLTSCQTQVEQLEADNDELQQRCGNQVYRLNTLSEECRDLRFRLQRQQRYTLQFKAALEKCLEVPPPSYGFFHHRDYSHSQSSMVDSEQASFVQPFEDSVPYPPETSVSESEDDNWMVQPLFPKVRTIKPWGIERSKASLESYQSDEADMDHDAIHAEGEEISHHPVRPVADNSVTFAGDRFHSTLVNLAQEIQNEGLVISDQSLTLEPEPVPEPTLIPEPEPVINEAAFSIANSDHGEEGDSRTSEPASSFHDQEETRSIANDAIAPFSSSHIPCLDSEAPLGNGDTAPSHLKTDKLWQSLVNLVDRSTDNFTQAGLEATTSKSRSMEPQPSTSFTDPWVESVEPSSTDSTMSQPTDSSSWTSQVSVSLDVEPTPFKNQIQPVESIHDVEPEKEAQKLSRRAIELPSFLAHSINPNLA